MSNSYLQTSSEVVGITPEKIRDVLTDCFNAEPKTIQATLRASFKQVGGNYDRPTKKHLELVIQALANKTGPNAPVPELMERHYALLQVLIGELN